MNKKKLLTLVASVALVGALGVGGTFALLSAQSNTVTNTFTVGHGLTDANIKLDEKDVDNSTPGTERDTQNSYKDIEPNTTLVKDPTVTISGDHAKCYVFVKVTGAQNMDSIKGVSVENFSKELKKISGEDDSLDGVYVYAKDGNPVVVEADADLKLVVFNGIKLDADAEIYDAGAAKKLDNIVVKACAVQCAGETDAYKNALEVLPEEFK